MASQEPIDVTLEFTPNPNTLKFVVNRDLMGAPGNGPAAANFTSVEKANHSPLAQALFSVPGVEAVMVSTNFVTITKGVGGDWDVLAEKVPATLESFCESGEVALKPEWFEEFSQKAQSSSANESDIEKRIREVLDSEIRPAVAMDGGDIVFDRFDKGVVYLQLQGSCSSCPSSVATLKMGVETRLREVVPEVTEVVQV